MTKEIRPSELPKGVTKRDVERLAIGLENLASCANGIDITRTAAALEISTDLVRKYLGSKIYKYETGKAIHDKLRTLTLERTHSIQKKIA
jgi:hypothetical protein